MPFGSGRKGAAEWADIGEIESDKLKVMYIYIYYIAIYIYIYIYIYIGSNLSAVMEMSHSRAIRNNLQAL